MKASAWAEVALMNVTNLSSGAGVIVTGPRACILVSASCVTDG